MTLWYVYSNTFFSKFYYTWFLGPSLSLLLSICHIYTFFYCPFLIRYPVFFAFYVLHLIHADTLTFLLPITLTLFNPHNNHNNNDNNHNNNYNHIPFCQQILKLAMYEISTDQLLSMSASELADSTTQLLRAQQRSSAALSSQVQWDDCRYSYWHLISIWHWEELH